MLGSPQGSPEELVTLQVPGSQPQRFNSVNLWWAEGYAFLISISDCGNPLLIV